MKVAAREIVAFQKGILAWYKTNKRDLPWRHPSLKLRDGSRDPYRILVSEVMLQQTQVSRVIPKYDSWLQAFPDFKSLAHATARDVLSHWSGLGYNRRALFLQKCAQEIVSRYKNIFPQDEKSLLTLPGIGEYTARAIMCFAFNKQVAVIDTNIKKVIAVHFFKGKVPDKHVLQEVAAALLPKGKSYEWNQALMDYAAMELQKEKIAIPRQSAFKDSDRYYRGQIVKLLLVAPFTKAELCIRLDISDERLTKILAGMEKDTLLSQDPKTKKFFV